MDAPLELPDEASSLEIVGRARAGDEAAWSALYTRHRDELLLAIRAGSGARLRACVQSEDLLQSVVLAAFQAMPRFEYRGKGSLRAFLHTLVRNRLRDRAAHFGAAKRRGGVALTDSVAAGLAAPAEPTYADPRFERLERALQRLDPVAREIVVQRRIEGRSTPEVAEALGRSEAAVRKVLSRAMARLTVLMREDASS